jgi:hypothetical protein
MLYVSLSLFLLFKEADNPDDGQLYFDFKPDKHKLRDTSAWKSYPPNNSQSSLALQEGEVGL